jgi:hypothetical protein
MSFPHGLLTNQFVDFNETYKLKQMLVVQMQLICDTTSGCGWLQGIT